MEKFDWYKDKESKNDASKIINSLDMSKNQENFYNNASDSEIERLVRESLPEYQDLIKKIQRLESESIKLRDLQNKYFLNLDNDLTEVNYLIRNYLNILTIYDSKKLKFIELNKKNLELHINIDDINLPITEEEKEINELRLEINELSKVIENEKIQEKLPELSKKYSELEKQVNNLRDLWYPKNPTDN